MARGRNYLGGGGGGGIRPPQTGPRSPIDRTTLEEEEPETTGPVAGGSGNAPTGGQIAQQNPDGSYEEGGVTYNETDDTTPEGDDAGLQTQAGDLTRDEETAPREGQSDIDALAEELVRQQMEAALAGGNTAEQEALMRQQSEQALGQGLVDSRARAGRAGFATGGMQMALEQDARSNSARQLGLDIIDERTREAQRVFDNAMAAGRYDIAAQAQATADALSQAKIDAFNAMIAGMPGAPQQQASSGGGSPVSLEQALAEPITTEAPTPAELENAPLAESQPEGSILVFSDGSGNYYRTADGSVVKVATRTATGG